jgi:hypothetical protein
MLEAGGAAQVPARDVPAAVHVATIRAGKQRAGVGRQEHGLAHRLRVAHVPGDQHDRGDDQGERAEPEPARDRARDAPRGDPDEHDRDDQTVRPGERGQAEQRAEHREPNEARRLARPHRNQDCAGDQRDEEALGHQRGVGRDHVRRDRDDGCRDQADPGVHDPASEVRSHHDGPRTNDAAGQPEVAQGVEAQVVDEREEAGPERREARGGHRPVEPEVPPRVDVADAVGDRPGLQRVPGAVLAQRRVRAEREHVPHPQHERAEGDRPSRARE